MLYLPISRSWVLSRSAQHVYFACALLILAELATLIGTRMALDAARLRVLTENARLLVRWLLFPEICGAAVLWVAMWYFWFGFDRSDYWKRAFSFTLLFFLGPVGSMIYYFSFYRRLVLVAQPKVTTKDTVIDV